MSASSHTRPTTTPLQKKMPADHSKVHPAAIPDHPGPQTRPKALLPRRRLSHGPSPLGRIASTPPKSASSRLQQRSPRRKSGRTYEEKSSVEALPADDKNLEPEDPSSVVGDHYPPTAQSGQAAAANANLASSTNKMDDVEDDDMGDDELDQLIEDFREWKLGMKTLMDDLESQLDELQQDFSTTLRAIPRNIVAV